MRVAILAAALVIVAASVAARRRAAGQGGQVSDDVYRANPYPLVEWVSDAVDGAAEAVTDVLGESFGFVRVAAIRTVNAAMLGERNIRAFLRVIREAEGTAGDDGYRTLFGGGTFSGFGDHPRITVKRSGYSSTAAGAYQMLASTWDETARALGLKDFSPMNQDLAALGRIAARGALDDVRGGRLDDAIRKCAREWASLPGSPYGQPTISAARVKQIFADAGGMDTGVA